MGETRVSGSDPTRSSDRPSKEVPIVERCQHPPPTIREALGPHRPRSAMAGGHRHPPAGAPSPSPSHQPLHRRSAPPGTPRRHVLSQRARSVREVRRLRDSYEEAGRTARAALEAAGAAKCSASEFRVLAGVIGAISTYSRVRDDVYLDDIAKLAGVQADHVGRRLRSLADREVIAYRAGHRKGEAGHINLAVKRRGADPVSPDESTIASTGTDPEFDSPSGNGRSCNSPTWDGHNESLGRGRVRTTEKRAEKVTRSALTRSPRRPTPTLMGRAGPRQ